MQYSNDPTFRTLLIVPNYPDNNKLTSSPTLRVATWEDLRDRPGNYAGTRFNQVIASDPPFADWQHEVWGELSRRVLPQGKMHIL